MEYWFEKMVQDHSYYCETAESINSRDAAQPG